VPRRAVFAKANNHLQYCLNI